MSPSNDQNFLESSIKLFRYYKKIGEGAIAQLSDEQVLQKPNELSNSIALIVHHISGNMLSRWTDFLTSDGEKPWRDREAEFEKSYANKVEMMDALGERLEVFARRAGKAEARRFVKDYLHPKRRPDSDGSYPASVGALSSSCGADHLSGKGFEGE